MTFTTPSFGPLPAPRFPGIDAYAIQGKAAAGRCPIVSRIEKGPKMKYPLKPIRDQVIVITGASSGIGLTTARYAAKRGAKLVLASRNEKALKQLTGELSRVYG